MIAKGLTIPTTFTAVDSTKSAVKSMVKGLGGYVKEAEAISARSDRAFRKLTPSLRGATKQLLAYGSAGAALGGLAYSAKAISDYEVAIQSLQAVTGVSDEQLVNFKYEITDLAKTSRKSSIDVAKSFETIGSNMSEYLTDPKGLRQIAEAGILLSKAARTELEPTLNDLTSIMNQFNIKAGQAAKTVDTLTAGEIVGSVHTSQLAGYLQQFGGVASAFNVSLDESVTLIETLGKQLPKEEIGRSARNLITFMSAAGGMDKKAVKSMHKYGVSIDLLMDKHTSLGVKLKELSKLKGDAIAMERFFGRENIAAGAIIFQQLGVYDEWIKKVQTTSMSQFQAAKNSSTLQQAIDRLKNTWVTLITTTNSASSGLEKVKSIVAFVTDHLDGLVTMALTVISVFTAWKIINIGMRASIFGLNVVLGIQNALFATTVGLLEENIAAQRIAIITKNALTTATEAWSIVTALATGNMAALNVVMIANPVGAVITGIVLLTGAISGLVYMNQQLYEQYERELSLRVVKGYEQESRTIETLAQRYIKLGLAKEEALKKSIQFERESIALSQVKNRAETESLQRELKSKQIMYNGIIIPLPGASDIQDKLLAKRKVGTELAAQSLGLTNYVISRTAIDKEDKKRNKSKFSSSETDSLLNHPLPFVNTKISDIETQNTTNTNNSNVTVTLQNNTDNTASIDSAGKTRTVMPATTTTMVTNKR